MLKSISKLEDSMYEASKNLEFEKAAQIRDEIQRLNSHLLK
ncbi:MAG: UvrB/UvrC motif-containing protein [Oceanospirillum sp.]|nr:UvrB/UvrC motif-containing protein [Oceanospirillum sp.]